MIQAHIMNPLAPIIIVIAVFGDTFLPLFHV